MELTRDVFNELLKRVNLSKKEFAELVGVQYSSVNNWGSGKFGVPYWVKSWLENYIKSLDMDKIVEVVKPYVDKDL